MATCLSSDGQDGSTVAKSSGIRLLEDDAQALVLRSQVEATRDGRTGTHAPQAIIGGPAGTLIVQLSESNSSQGAIRVQRRPDNPSHVDLPIVTEVPIGRDLRLTAIGGRGENGHNGGDGQRGRDGENGVGASEADDATNGAKGGRGGDAGRGSSGADGGAGGDIHVIVNEDNTHLLMAVSYDIRGGEGGAAGRHGASGSGGVGGQGGEGWQWERIIGYKFSCTKSCIKSQDTSGSSSALTRTSTQLTAHANALRAQTQALVVRGTNVQNIIAQAALRYNALTQPRRDTGYCKCGGGSGSCQGCDVTPIKKNLKRVPGFKGEDGERGSAITTLLTKGRPGVEGTFTIAVKYRDDSTQEYYQPWSLELVDFEIEDENGDGIFEPGEHLFIRRIKVRNVGGMPSPTCMIPVTLAVGVESDWFETVPTHEGGVAYLPTSIPVGATASSEGSLKVKIKSREQGEVGKHLLGTEFLGKDMLRIRADMPWLERRLPSFNFAKEVTIQYPCALEGFRYLDTAAQGSISKVQFKVINTSNRPFGSSSDSGRDRSIQVRVEIPEDFGQLFTVDEIEQSEVVLSVPYTRPKDSQDMEQQFCILSNARSHKHFPIVFELWLESPAQDPSGDMLEEILVQRHTIHLQVSNKYVRSENADLLLITNPCTTERQSLAIQYFLRNSLKLRIDICNIHQNGGLLNARDDDFDDPLPLIGAYRNKMILVLDNTFTFFDAGVRTTSQLCDPQWISDLAASGTSTLFVGCEAGTLVDGIIRSAVLLPPTKVEDTVKQVSKSRVFSTREELVTAINQETRHGSARMGVSALILRPHKWYRFGRDKSIRQARKLVDYLNSQLPNERFLVTYASSIPQPNTSAEVGAIGIMEGDQTETVAGCLVILTGLGHQCSLVSTEAAMNIDPGTGRLDLLSQFTLVAGVPPSPRLRLLWNGVYNDIFITEAVVLSLATDIMYEILGFMSSSPSDTIFDTIASDKATSNPSLKPHLPILCTLFEEDFPVPPKSASGPLKKIYGWTLVFTARHKRLDALVRSMLATHASVQELKDYRPSAEFDPDALIRNISKLTKTPENILTRGQTSGRDVVPRTQFCTTQEWNKKVEDVVAWRQRLTNDMECAHRQMGRMLVNEDEKMM